MQRTIKEVAAVLDRAIYCSPGVFDLPQLRCIHCGRQGLLDTRGERRILLCSSVLARYQEFCEESRRDYEDDGGFEDFLARRTGVRVKASPRTPLKASFLFGVPLKEFECTSPESDVVLYLWPNPESLALLYS